jgi:hypothetical protein
LSAVPQDLRIDASDRTPAAGSSGGSYYASSDSGGDKEGKDAKQNQPLFAMGGVFPKQDGPRKRKESAAAKEREKERQEERQSSGETTSSGGGGGGVGRKPSTRARRLAEEERYPSYSSGAVASDSSNSPSHLVQSPNNYGSRERTDPFEDLRQPSLVTRESQVSRRSRASRRSATKESPEAPPPLATSPSNFNHDEERAAPSLHDSEVLEERPSSETVIEEDMVEGNASSKGDLGEGPLSPVNEQSDASSIFSRVEEDGASDDETQHSEGEEGEEPRSKHEDKKNWPKEAEGEQPAVGGELNQESSQWEGAFSFLLFAPPLLTLSRRRGLRSGRRRFAGAEYVGQRSLFVFSPLFLPRRLTHYGTSPVQLLYENLSPSFSVLLFS